MKSIIVFFASSFLAYSLTTAASAATCENGTHPSRAVAYHEMPVSSDHFSAGRPLWPQSHPEFGIDINSWVRIAIDTECLQTLTNSLETPTDVQLDTRLEALTQTVRALGEAVDSTNRTLATSEGDNEEEFRKAADSMGRNVSTVLGGLQRAQQLRLEASGLEAATARRVSENSLSEVLPGGGIYDWTGISERLNEELRVVYREIQRQRDATSLKLQIVARLIGKNGVHPVRLSGLNEVPTGPFSPVGMEVVDLTASLSAPQATKLETTVKATEEKGTNKLPVIAARLLAGSLDSKKSDVEAKKAGRSAEEQAKEDAAAKKAEDVEAARKNAEGIVKTAADLPLPPGQRTPSLDSGPILTSFNLGTISQSRAENDIVRIAYAIVREKVDGGLEVVGPSWEDNFTLRQYGWRQTLSGGFAFLQPESTNDWKPTGVVNYTLDWRRWAKGAADPGLLNPSHDEGRRRLVNFDWFSGVGLSLLTPDFDEEQDLEVGLGLHASFLANRVTVGYGVNLSADEDREFTYLSFNLFKGQIFDKIAKLAGGTADSK